MSIEHLPEGMIDVHLKGQATFLFYIWVLSTHQISSSATDLPQFSCTNFALSAMASYTFDLPLKMLATLADFYRNTLSVMGRVERMEEDIEVTEGFHRELVDVHLPDLPDDCDEIDREMIKDREIQIRV